MEKRDLILEQIRLQENIKNGGVNLVTCGNCGAVILHATDKETITCYDCESEMDLSDCSDMFYSGMENESKFANYKHLLITLEVQDGEHRHTHRVLHTTRAKNIGFAGERYVSTYYENFAYRNDVWWNFNGGTIAVRLERVVELSYEQVEMLKPLLY